MRILLCVVVFVFSPVLLFAQEVDGEYRLIAWNVEGITAKPHPGTGDPGNIDTVIRQMEDKQGVDIWALSEAHLDFFARYETAAGVGEEGDFKLLPGTTGQESQRLAIIYDRDQFEIIDGPKELVDPPFDVQMDRSGLRGSLYATFREKRPGGQSFVFMVNHLVRGRREAGDEDNEDQAELLNAWARTQELPIINVGDFNFDVPLDDADGEVLSSDRGIDELTEGGIFEWIRPTTLLKTQHDDRFDTILDFVFIGNKEKAEGSWSVSSRILAREGDTLATTVDFDDDRSTADHRPVDAIFQMVDAPVDRNLADRVAELEREVEELRRLVEALRDQ